MSDQTNQQPVRELSPAKVSSPPAKPASLVSPVGLSIADKVLKQLEGVLDPARLMAELDVSETTSRAYCLAVQIFSDWLETTDPGADCLFRFKDHLDDQQDLKNNTKNSYLTGAKVYAKALYSHRKGLLTDPELGPLLANPESARQLARQVMRRYLDQTQPTKTEAKRAAKAIALVLERLTSRPEINRSTGRPIKGFQFDQRHRAGLNDDDIAALMNWAAAESDSRTRALIGLFALAGLRSAEVVGLDVTDVDLDGAQLSVIGKGDGDSRTALPIRPALVQLLAEYLADNNLKSGPLFINQSNNGCGRLTTRGIRQMFAKIFKAAGVRDGVSVHGFRHYYTTRLLTHYQGDVAVVSQFTRHKSYNTLKRYNDSRLTADTAASCQAFVDLEPLAQCQS